MGLQILEWSNLGKFSLLSTLLRRHLQGRLPFNMWSTHPTVLKPKKNISMENEEQKEDTWSNLPTLLVWMIKARLDYPNNLRFAAVCKSWLNATSAYPLNYQSGVDAPPPWIMIGRGEGDSEQEFYSVLTEEKYTIDVPDLCHSTLLSSKQGWLFLVKDGKSDSPILLNPFTKVKIELPYTNTILASGAFTVVDGNPHSIVIVRTRVIECGMCPCINLDITHPGDNGWISYSYRRLEPRKFFLITEAIIVGQLVYCLTEGARVFVFNLANLQWTDLMEKAEMLPISEFEKWYVAESEGEVLQARLSRENGGDTSTFYRLNDANTDWEPMNDEDLEDTCWFLREQCKGCFVLKGKGIEDKIYNACWKLEDEGYVKFDFYESDIMVGRLLCCKRREGKLRNPCCRLRTWVDMG